MKSDANEGISEAVRMGDMAAKSRVEAKKRGQTSGFDPLKVQIYLVHAQHLVKKNVHGGEERRTAAVKWRNVQLCRHAEKERTDMAAKSDAKERVEETKRTGDKATQRCISNKTSYESGAAAREQERDPTEATTEDPTEVRQRTREQERESESKRAKAREQERDSENKSESESESERVRARDVLVTLEKRESENEQERERKQEKNRV